MTEYNLLPLLPNDWQLVLGREGERILRQIDAELASYSSNLEVYPPYRQVFNALQLTSFEDVKVVILGQDPYHQPNQAHGLAFSVPKGIALPPSLRNIARELIDDTNAENVYHGDLTPWAKQGVLLLNSILTVVRDQPGSHQKIGWQAFTDLIISAISCSKEGVVFVLWGNFARSKEILVDSEKHLILHAPHPSPLSAYSGFFGSRPFSKANAYLKDHSLTAIDWSLDQF